MEETDRSVTFQFEEPLFFLTLEDDKVVKVGSYVFEKETTILRKYVNVFAWSSSDLTCVSPQLITHKINIPENIKPVQQKQRLFAANRDLAIKEELTQLLQADIIYEVQYPTWLANPVMVRKADGGWRMCINFNDLNKNCPKDCYPLPSVEKKVAATVGYEVLSFLDLYKGYHQVFMDHLDSVKTTFITNWGIYAYKKMSFGLKNAGATYQRLVDKSFQVQNW